MKLRIRLFQTILELLKKMLTQFFHQNEQLKIFLILLKNLI